jgi:glycine cleavage system regulatory protein
MTIIGQDRPGLVSSVARTVAEHGGNWLESRMSRLGGHFAGILRVQVPANRADKLAEALRALQQGPGLQVVIQPDQPAPAAQVGKLYSLELIGQDRPGIVRQISDALARSSVNVEELHTELTSAAMSGESHFRAQALLSVPPACDLAKLRRELESIAEDLIVDVSLAELQNGQKNPARTV